MTSDRRNTEVGNFSITDEAEFSPQGEALRLGLK